jgi:hypothetical protein
MTSPDKNTTPPPGAEPVSIWPCAFVDPELDEAIVAEMDEVFAMDRILGEIDADIRKVRQQPPALPRVYYVPRWMVRKDDVAWLARDDILALIEIYRSSADQLAERLPPDGLDPDPCHLDEQLAGKILIHADGSADPTIEAEIRRLKRRIERQVIGPLVRPQFDRFGDMPGSLVVDLLDPNLLSPSGMWCCHLFRAGMLKRCRVHAA